MFLFQLMFKGLEVYFKSPKSYEWEAKHFGQLVKSKEAAALMGLFKGQTACKKNHVGAPKKPAQ